MRLCDICIGVGAQSTLGGHKIFARKIYIKNQQNARMLHDSCQKNYQNTGIFMIFTRKFTKFPKNFRILRNNCPKHIFSRILGGYVPPAPVSYAYGYLSVYSWQRWRRDVTDFSPCVTDVLTSTSTRNKSFSSSMTLTRSLILSANTACLCVYCCLSVG